MDFLFAILLNRTGKIGETFLFSSQKLIFYLRIQALRTKITEHVQLELQEKPVVRCINKFSPYHSSF